MKKLLIIGAGIAGLSAGVYAQRSGFDVTILEQHSIPGGMCTSWRRNGYLFEGAIHWMTGSSPNTALHKMWRDVGALGDDVAVRYDDPFLSVDWEGQIVHLYRDPDKLQAHFNEVSPEDADTTKQLVSYVRAFTKMEMPVMDIKGLKTAKPRKMSMGAVFNMLPALMKMGSVSKLSTAEYISRFRHPALRMLLSNIVTDEYGATSLLFTLATLAAGDGGYPEGGSLAMTKRMADTFTGLGGTILYNTKAEKVLVENGAAAGVIANGEAMPADVVIITLETLAAVERLFDEPPKDEWLLRLKRETKPAACCFICVGVNAQVSEMPVFMLDEPIRCGGFSYSSLGLHCYAGYPGYAPEGATALTTAFMGDSYEFWKKAREEGRYEAEKQAVAEQVRHALCKKYPFMEGNIDVIDIATPLTYERYTGASKGSWMSVMGKGESNASYPCTLEHAAGVYFAGHRTMSPGGLPVALASGRTAAQLACRQFDMLFV